MAVKVISNDSEFTKHIKANKFVLAIFVEENSVLEVTDQQRWDHLLSHFLGKPDRLDQEPEEGEFYQSASISNTRSLHGIRHRGGSFLTRDHNK